MVVDRQKNVAYVSLLRDYFDVTYKKYGDVQIRLKVEDAFVIDVITFKDMEFDQVNFQHIFEMYLNVLVEHPELLISNKVKQAVDSSKVAEKLKEVQKKLLLEFYQAS